MPGTDNTGFCSSYLSVHPDSLRTAAAVFDRASDDVAADGARLAGTSKPDTGSDVVNALLTAVLHNGGTNLAELSRVMAAHAERLRSCASNYQLTDDDAGGGLRRMP